MKSAGLFAILAILVLPGLILVILVLPGLILVILVLAILLRLPLATTHRRCRGCRGGGGYHWRSGGGGCVCRLRLSKHASYRVEKSHLLTWYKK